jgi:hypothetical protein
LLALPLPRGAAWSDNHSMRKASVLIAFLAAAPAGADDAAAAAAAHAAVREALLERATLPIEHGPAHDQGPAQLAHEHVARARQEEAERAAHTRAATHGARHSRETHPEHDGGAPAHGPAHGGSSMHGSGMDGGWDAHDPAEHERTRGMHDEGMQPDHDGPHGP